jgi:transcriptional regulator with XRE-family HTH domain
MHERRTHAMMLIRDCADPLSEESAMTFGSIITDARKAAGLSQKELAARIKKEDGTPISPQYLNDLEHDRRNPPSSHLLKQFAQELGEDYDYLAYLGGQLPDDLRDGSHRREQVVAGIQAFRRELKGHGR